MHKKYSSQTNFGFLQTDGNSDCLIEDEDDHGKDEIEKKIERAPDNANSLGPPKKPLGQQPQQQQVPQSSLSKLLYDTKNHTTLLKIFSSSSSSTQSNSHETNQRILKIPYDSIKAFKLNSNLQLRFDRSGIRNELIQQLASAATSAQSSANLSNLNLSLNTQLNEQIISPKSDESDSSLNLDFTNVINNNLPLIPCYGPEEEDRANRGNNSKKLNIQSTLVNEQKYSNNKAVDIKNKVKKQRTNSNDSTLNYYTSSSINTVLRPSSSYQPHNPTNKALITKCSNRPKVHNATIKELLDNQARLKQQQQQGDQVKEQPETMSVESMQNTETEPIPFNSQVPIENKNPLKEQNSMEIDKPPNKQNNSISKPPRSKKSTQPKRKNFSSSNELSSYNNENENYEKFIFNYSQADPKTPANIEKELNDCNLFFEISSDDGFFVQSKSIDGKFNCKNSN